MEEPWRSRRGVVQDRWVAERFRGSKSGSRALGRLFWRLKSAQDAIFGVLGAPRGDFWRLKSALDAILGVLGGPRGDFRAF